MATEPGQLENILNETATISDNIDEWSKGVAAFEKRLKGATEGVSKLSDKSGMTNLTINTQDIEKLKKIVESTKKSMEKSGSGISMFASEASSAKDFISRIKNINIGSLAKSFKKEFEEAFDAIGSGASDTDKALKSLGAMGAMGKFTQGFEKLSNINLFGFNYNEVQKNLTEISKSALNIGQSFGKSFIEAEGDVYAFLHSLGKTQASLYATREEVLGVRKGLSGAFTALDMSMPTKSVEGLSDALHGAGVEVNLTNAAMLTSKATGMDQAKVVNILSESHLDLGLSASDAVTSMAIMREAGRDSKLQFDKVADGIFGAAKTLKYYGGSVEAISPVFKRFNETLRGMGREGLTPELLGDLVGGLQKMTLESRALLSLSAPGMATGVGGALGGGLAMEQALEEGDMDTVTKGLIETIKKYSGGQGVLTREQALENPASQRAYIIQRQMLQKLTGIQDAGKQDMMLKLLGDVDKHGVSGNVDAKAQLKEMMSSGKETAEATTTDLMKMQRQQDAIFTNQGVEIIGYLKKISEGTGISKALRAVGRMAKSVSGVGTPNTDTLKGALSTKRVSEENLEGSDLVSAQTQNLGADASKLYDQNIAGALAKTKNKKDLRQFRATGEVSGDLKKAAFAKSTAGIDSRIDELGETNDKTKSQRFAIKTELANLKRMKKMIKNKELNPAGINKFLGGSLAKEQMSKLNMPIEDRLGSRIKNIQGKDSGSMFENLFEENPMLGQKQDVSKILKTDKVSAHQAQENERNSRAIETRGGIVQPPNPIPIDITIRVEGDGNIKAELTRVAKDAASEQIRGGVTGNSSN